MKAKLAKNRVSIFILCTIITVLIGGGAIAFFSNGDAESYEQKATSSSQQGEGTNRLINEKSPYLLQHAHNPVDWYPWGQEAFARARKENKLIFLSIGYSTCYWCHVMERQVFENEELAGLMNKYFVSIKVDREERPDVDRVYMSALQAMTGGGGWPMSMFLTPDLKPFYGATYIPPDSFQNIIVRMNEIWTNTPENIRLSSERITDYLKQQTVTDRSIVELEKSILAKGFEQFRRSYDRQYAGFGQGPKFPRPVTFNFLLRYYSRFGEQEALQMTLATLRKMAESGMYDHIGGGFHRYSVDGQWRVPHFEKMLYDQAQLVSSYLDAYQITHDEFYASVARDTLTYVLRDMTYKDGGFYSAEDAESALDANKLDEKEEGAFYVWTRDETSRALGKERAAVFNYVYGVQAGGNALADPHQVFVGKNILYTAHSVDEAAKYLKKPPEAIKKLLAESRAKLFAERAKRPRPHLDDKILVSWNGLMISALARAYQVLEDPAYLQAAGAGADFILGRLYDAKAKQLLRRYRAGEARYEANLEDYAFFTMGLLDLYEAALDKRWLKQAIELTDRQNSLFYDEKSGGFFDTSGKDDSLLFRTKEDYDAAEPAGNSIAVWNLLRLAQMTDNKQWRAMADRTLALLSGRLKEVPQALPQMLVALDFHLDKPKQIIIAGNPQKEDTRNMLREVHKRYTPNKIILLADGGDGQQFLSHYIPFIKSISMIEGKATVYICENYACKLPTADLSVMAELLEGREKK
ncbi:MAG: thioredoxin domain-containing protein [Blastocatellia bacterium]|nr:thioredoxin domain-containing protein [Blastocatellia bacterium]